MKLVFPDASSWTAAVPEAPISIEYGKRYDVTLECVDQAGEPMDAEALGMRQWKAALVSAVNEGYDLADWTIDLPRGNVFNVSIGAFAPLLYEYLGGRTDMAAIMQLRGYEIDGSASTLSVTIQFPVLLQCDGNTKCPMDLHSVLLEQLAYAVDDAYKAAARAELAAAAVPDFSKTHMSMASMDSFLATLGAQLNCTYTRTWDEAQGVWVFTATPL
jgi:hypothetical protein